MDLLLLKNLFYIGIGSLLLFYYTRYFFNLIYSTTIRIIEYLPEALVEKAINHYIGVKLVSSLAEKEADLNGKKGRT